MKSAMLHERRYNQGLTPYAPYAAVIPDPGIAAPNSCTLGQTWFYDPGTTLQFNPFFTQDTQAFGVAQRSLPGGYYFIAPQGAAAATQSITLTSGVFTPASTYCGFRYTHTQLGTVTGSGLDLRILQISTGANGSISARVQASFTASNYTLTFRVMDSVGAPLYSVALVTIVATNPISSVYTGYVQITRTDGATTVYRVYLNGVLVATYDYGSIDAATQVVHYLHRRNADAGANQRSELFEVSAPYYIGTGLSGTCAGAIT